MDLESYADALNVEINITRHSNQASRYTASLANCDVKQGGLLAGVYGNGKNPIQAMNDYTSQIIGKRLVFHAASPKRYEVKCPVLGRIIGGV